jgi:hypothetical protein
MAAGFFAVVIYGAALVAQSPQPLPSFEQCIAYVPAFAQFYRAQGQEVHGAGCLTAEALKRMRDGH